MPRICEVCGAAQEQEEAATAALLLHVCENCIRDRAPYEHRTSLPDNSVLAD